MTVGKGRANPAFEPTATRRLNFALGTLKSTFIFWCVGNTQKAGERISVSAGFVARRALVFPQLSSAPREGAGLRVDFTLSHYPFAPRHGQV